MPEREAEEAVSLALPDSEIAGAEVDRLPLVHAGRVFGTGKIEELKLGPKALDV